MKETLMELRTYLLSAVSEEYEKDCRCYKHAALETAAR